MRRGDGAALLGFGSVGFEIRLLRVSGLAVRKIAFQMLIFTAVGLQIRPSGARLCPRLIKWFDMLFILSGFLFYGVLASLR